MIGATNWRGEPAKVCYQCGGKRTRKLDAETRECRDCGTQYAVDAPDRYTMPALIIAAPHAGAIVEGLPLGNGKRWFKTVECRGPLAHTDYRGALAIFCSRNYVRAVEDHYVKLRAHLTGKRGAAAEFDTRVWCQYRAAWSYRLCGFVRVVNSLRFADLMTEPDRERRGARSDELMRRAGSYDVEADEPPLVWLTIERLAERQLADGPRFDAVCVGCQAKPPHNPSGCHVNIQTVNLQAQDVPVHVQKEIKPWPKQQR